MIPDISQFAELFKSLSLVSQWRFEFFYNKGLVVGSGPDPATLPVTREIHDLSERIVKQAASQHVFFQGDYEILGVPVKDEGEIIGSLIAHRLIAQHERHPRDPSGKTG